MSVCITMHNCLFVGFPAPCHECCSSKVSSQIHYSLVNNIIAYVVNIIKLLLCEYNLRIVHTRCPQLGILVDVIQNQLIFLRFQDSVKDS